MFAKYCYKPIVNQQLRLFYKSELSFFLNVFVIHVCNSFLYNVYQKLILSQTETQRVVSNLTQISFDFCQN